VRGDIFPHNNREITMSLVHCRGCGHAIHATAVACPKCGAPQLPPGALAVGSTQGTRPAGSSRQALIGLAAVFGTLVLLGLFGAMGNADRAASPEPSKLAEVATGRGESAAVREPRIMSDEDAEDATARSLIQTVANAQSTLCDGMAPALEQTWAMYLQMGRHPGYKNNFFRLVENAEKRGCL
jgi:hypothetical protein